MITWLGIISAHFFPSCRHETQTLFINVITGSNHIHMYRWRQCPLVTSRTTSPQPGCTGERELQLYVGSGELAIRLVLALHVVHGEEDVWCVVQSEATHGQTWSDGLSPFLHPLFRFPSTHTCTHTFRWKHRPPHASVLGAATSQPPPPHNPL